MELAAAMLCAIGCISLIAWAVRSRRKTRELSASEEAERLKREEEGLAKARAELDRLCPEVLRLCENISRLSAYDNGYLMKRDWDRLLESAKPTISALSRIPAQIVESSESAPQISYLRRCCSDTGFRESRNASYKAVELRRCDALLSNVDGGKSLDPQQRDAVVTDEYSNLVIAGAGSGKTSVVVGKVKYLVERWGYDPSEILVTSFTRASVDDLRRRIEASGVSGVTAKTFHALGLDVLGEVAVAADNALDRHVTSYLSDRLVAHPDQASAFLEFFGMWSLTPGESPDSKEAEARMKLLKAQDMRTLKGLVWEAGHEDGLNTMCGERVKSVEELMIANFLFLNGVDYEYERPYDHVIPDELRDEGRRAYQPDFYLTQYDIWLEHFGVDERGRVPWMKTAIEERAYLDGMEWKRKVHQACGTRLIESYSWWNKDQDLLNKVESLLRDCGVELRIDAGRNAEMCGELMRDQRFFGSMSQLISTFISLAKSSNKSAPEVDDHAREAYRGNGAAWHRYDLFTRFAWPIMESYQRSLSEGPVHRVDFDDMINEAAARIRRDGYPHRFRYIIVDEYQDISLSRFGLLSAIRDATGAKLMCVGDDWQAIYRFAGSDVTLFTNFGKLVGFFEEMRIERTYRNSQRLVDVASAFVLKNPDQLRKRVTSMAPALSRPPVAAVSLADQRAAFTFALNDLLSLPGRGGEIKVLGRNRRDLERIFPGLAPVGGFSFRDPRRNSPAEEKFDKVITYRPDAGEPVELGYMTVHKSKGLQADNVIVIGLVNDRYGFPNMVADDPILELLLADSDRYDFAEERRLFYVALTRTKGVVWLVTGDDAGNPGMSAFVDELRRDCREDAFVLYSQEGSDEAARCPRCGGVLLRRSGPTGDFVGCSNYPFCDKAYRDVRILEDRRRCPKCGGWLTRRVRRDGGGEFFGCTNWPTYCNYTMDIGGGDGRGQRPASHARTDAAGFHGQGGRPLAPRRGGGATLPSADVGYQRQRKPPATARAAGSTPICPECGAPLAIKSGLYGRFLGCTRFPSCRYTQNLADSQGSVRRYHTDRTESGGAAPRCPKCGAEMVVRKGRRGSFYSCTRFPSCKGSRDLRG